MREFAQLGDEGADPAGVLFCVDEVFVVFGELEQEEQHAEVVEVVFEVLHDDRVECLAELRLVRLVVDAGVPEDDEDPADHVCGSLLHRGLDLELRRAVPGGQQQVCF